MHLSLSHCLRFRFLNSRLAFGRRTDGSSLLRSLIVLSSRLLGDLRLAHSIEFYFPDRLELLHLCHQVVGRCHFLFGFLLLAFFGEHLFCLVLYVFVALELGDESMILLVGNLGTEIGIIPNLSKTSFIFQEINCRLKSYIQFSQYFI